MNNSFHYLLALDYLRSQEMLNKSWLLATVAAAEALADTSAILRVD